MITVYLTRHGQTVWNLDKRLQGSGNSDLTDHGVEQAEQLKKRVDGLKLDVIYTSPLERARKTANIIRGNRNIEIIEVDAFKEISFGEYEGHTEEELLKVGRGKEIKEIFTFHNIQTKIIAASIRNPIHVIESARGGADIGTVPPSVIKQLIKHPLTDIGIKKFEEDWKSIK